VETNIFEMGIERGSLETLVRSVELTVKGFPMNLREAGKGLEISTKEYENAKRQIELWEVGYGADGTHAGTGSFGEESAAGFLYYIKTGGADWRGV